MPGNSRFSQIYRPTAGILALLILAAAFVHGCGGTSFLAAGSSSSGLIPGTTLRDVTSGETLYGRLSTVPSMPVLNELAQAKVRENRATLEARGLKASERGDLIVWPPMPASAWLVRCGDQTLVCDANGQFSLTAPNGDRTTEVFLFHPSSQTLRTSLLLGQLSPDPDHPKELAIPMAFKGPCGMNEGDADEFCRPADDASARAIPASHPEIRARYLPPQWVRPANKAIDSYGIVLRPEGVVNPLGTYPPPDEYISKDCPRYDGELFPGLSQIDAFETLTYLDSICDFNVLDGACPNENPLSDNEYRAFALAYGQLSSIDLVNYATYASLVRLISALPFEPEFLTPPQEVGNGIDFDCEDNHRGRTCGDFLLGDIVVATKDQVIRAGEAGEIFVLPGERSSFVVHNNGVFGFTEVSREGASLLELSQEFLTSETDRLRIEHFDPRPPARALYVPDREIEYEISSDAKDGDRETLTMSVDNRTVTLTFVVQQSVNINPEQVTLGVDGSQEFTVSTGLPRTGETFVFEWDLANDTGALSSLTEPAVTYSVRDTTLAPAQDTLTVKVFTRDQQGLKRPYGEDSATISIVETGVVVSPAESDLEPGQSETFTSTVIGQPSGTTLEYQWESLGGSGTLSSTDQPSTTYTVSGEVQPGTVDNLKLTVFTLENGDRQQFGQDVAVVSVISQEPTPTPTPDPTDTPTPPCGPVASFISPPFQGSAQDVPDVEPYTMTLDRSVVAPGDFITGTYVITDDYYVFNYPMAVGVANASSIQIYSLDGYVFDPFYFYNGANSYYISEANAVGTHTVVFQVNPDASTFGNYCPSGTSPATLMGAWIFFDCGGYQFSTHFLPITIVP